MAVCQLTSLRDLSLVAPSTGEETMMLQLTHLKQLTRLFFEGPFDEGYLTIEFDCEVSLTLLCCCDGLPMAWWL